MESQPQTAVPNQDHCGDKPHVHAEKPKIDVKLLDQQLADCDSDEFDSDDDSHGGGCGCCAGLVGTIRSQ